MNPCGYCILRIVDTGAAVEAHYQFLMWLALTIEET